jgi:tRNA wybutosine-synthesizing protein 2
MVRSPFQEITYMLKDILPLELNSDLPDKWEKIGDILIIKVPTTLIPYATQIGAAYAKILNCRSVLNELQGIIGMYRQPQVQLIFGSDHTETIHVENSIRYKLDPQQIMFSSGNMDERLRMATIADTHETVVDLFAGIGYFTLPLAVYSAPKKIVACEINPVSYHYLCDNIVLNDVTTIVEPLQGDNRVCAPQNLADRVIMGYFNDTHEFFKTAIKCLRHHTGIVHYHTLAPIEQLPETLLTKLRGITQQFDRDITLLQSKIIKSYAPGINHIVFDIQVGEP